MAVNVYLCKKKNTVSSEDVVGMVDKCKEKNEITFYKTFCIRTLILVILYI